MANILRFNMRKNINLRWQIPHIGWWFKTFEHQIYRAV